MTFETPLQSYHFTFITLKGMTCYLNCIHVKMYPEDISVLNHRNAILHVKQYNKCLTNVHVKFCRYRTLSDNIKKIHNAKSRVFIFIIKKKKCDIYFTIPGTVKHLFFNLQNWGKYFKCQNIHAECDLAYKHHHLESL